MKKRVLIADADDKFRNELVAAFGESEEFEVLGVAVNGEEVLQLVENNQPDILVLDLLLPYCDGLSLLDRLPDCKVFAVTGFISDYILSVLEERQISGLLKKPCFAQDVAEWVVEVLQQNNELCVFTVRSFPPNIVPHNKRRWHRRRRR